MRAMGRNDVRGRSDLYRRLVRTGRCGMVDRYPLEGVEVGGGGGGECRLHIPLHGMPAGH